VGKTRGDTFPHSFAPPLSFRLVLTAFENLEDPWDAQGSTLLLFCFLNGFQLLFRVKQVVKNIVQRPAPGPDSCEWLGVRDSIGKCLGQWAPLVCFKLIPEQTQNPDNLVKYLQKVCCHSGNSRETQITATCWGLAHAYRALFDLIQCPKGERGGNEAAGTAAGAAPPAHPAAPPAQQAVTAPQPAPRLLQPLALSRLPRRAWKLLNLQLHPQLRQQASRLSSMTNLCREQSPL